MNRHHFIPLATLAFGVILGAVGSVSMLTPRHSAVLESQRKTIVALQQIESTHRVEDIVVHALQAFQRDTGSFPSGGNAEVLAALRDHSPDSLRPLNRDARFDSTGHLLDPWGTAFEITVQADRVVIRSVGPDRTGTTSDDIYTDTGAWPHHALQRTAAGGEPPSVPHA